MASLSGLSMALSSSPSTHGGGVKSAATMAKNIAVAKKVSVSAGAFASTLKESEAGVQQVGSFTSKSLPVNIPTSRERNRSVGSSVGTPRGVVSRERNTSCTELDGSAKLSGLVAPVRPASYGSDKAKTTMGFTPNEHPLTRPLVNNTMLETTTTTTTTTGPKLPPKVGGEPQEHHHVILPRKQSLKSASCEGKPSLLTMALESEEESSVAGSTPEVENPVLASGFATRNEELALAQEKRISADLMARHEVFGSPLVKLAFELGRCAHMGQLRRNGEAYLSHVVETAEILARFGLDEETVAAGLLHDVLDDTMMTEQQLREYIPQEVVDMVVGVSRLSHVSQVNRDLGFGKSQDSVTQGESFKNMLLSMADVRVVLIKLADRLHNMRTLNALSPEKQRTIAEETMHVFVPLANRLGVWSIKAELEDLCFKYLNQADFLALQNCLNDDFMKVQKINLQNNLDKLQKEMKRMNFDYKDLHGRPKNVYGIHKKMQKKGIAFEEVYDLCACRVIVRSKSECYKVLELVHSIWKPVEGKFKDYVKNPKENGYESLHTVVVDEEGRPFEIQIRTADMHFIAEYGLAAHWQYKESHTPKMKKNKRAEQQIAWNRWLVTWQMELQDRKFRPSGSPDNLKEVFVSFPEDEPSPPADLEYDPIYALISSNGNVKVKEVPANCSLYQLSKDILKAKPGTKFLINNEFHDSDDYTLKMGDLVEMVDVDYFADEFDVEESDDEPLFELFDFERQKLDKMYNESRYSIDEVEVG